jgi:GT2 family glycosyltransferase
MNAPVMSVVLVSWNSEDALADCILSLRESAERAGEPVELIVVDNASADGSRTRASELGADVVVANPVNAGYGVAAAQGIARATTAWALLLNPDIVVDRVFVSALAAAIRAAPADVATLVPDLRFASDRSIVNCHGIEVDETGVPGEVDSGADAAGLDPGRSDVFGGSSGACLLRLSAVREVGGIEPAFFAYFEDVDLAWQLRRAGYRASFVAGALAFHEGSASLGADSPLKAFLVARNRRVLFRLDGPHTFRARVRRTVVELGHATVMTLSGAAGAPWRGRADAVRLRTYTSFVRESRRRGRTVVEPTLAPPVPLLRMLRRKRAARHAMIGE